MTGSNDKKPDCYGVLDIVFPVDPDDGLRQTPAGCFDCRRKTECLKTALAGKDGLKAEDERVDRAFDSGMIGFFERWSRKKVIHKKRKMGDQLKK